jgi:hypothetical protein
MRVIRRRKGSGSTGTNRVGALLVGALAGVALGMLLADRGGLEALRRGLSTATGADEPESDDDDADDADQPAPRQARSASAPPRRTAPASEPVPNDEAELEARVLETFRNDPILVDRPVDICAIGTGIIELTGWVDVPQEVRHATTLTRGTIGVHTVVNRLLVRGVVPTTVD